MTFAPMPAPEVPLSLVVHPGDAWCSVVNAAAPGDTILFSAGSFTDTCSISVSGTPGTDYDGYLRAVDRLLGQFDARVHWGKLH